MSFLIAAVATVAATTTQAQTPKAPPPPPPVKASPATLQAATALITQIGLKRQLETQMSRTVAQMRTGVVVRAMLAQQPGFVQAYQANKATFDPALQKAGAIQADIAQGIINQNMPALVNAARDAYARQFSAAELNALVAFYKSPAGIALQQKQGAVSGEIAQETARLIGARIDAAMQANAPKLRAALAPLSNVKPPAAPAKK